ncbi:MAG TPA: hypothetical protein VGZ25_08285 [Gemmataceae bacterium]|jgi:hypothetical protein|nr:hypothetical protein [Gemmataceae bacterium]
MITVKARYDGRVFVPETPVDLPVGCVLEITLPNGTSTSDSKAPLKELAEVIGQFPSDPAWPEDAAAQHDHYLYGTPRRP